MDKTTIMRIASKLGVHHFLTQSTKFLRGLLAFSVIAIVSPTALAGVIITYQDVGSNLQFDYAGSLNYTASGSSSYPYGAVGLQGDYNPIFYNNPDEYGWLPDVSLVSHTAGLWGTSMSQVTCYTCSVASSGDTFMMRMNFNDSLPVADSLNIWGDWGAANTAFAGSLTVNGSIASFGMVDGYTISTTGGDIVFRNANSVPEPTTLALLALGLIGVAARQRQVR